RIGEENEFPIRSRGHHGVTELAREPAVSPAIRPARRIHPDAHRCGSHQPTFAGAGARNASPRAAAPAAVPAGSSRCSSWYSKSVFTSQTSNAAPFMLLTVIMAV